MRWSPDLKGPDDEATTDGQAECSPDVGGALELLPDAVKEDTPGLCHSIQHNSGAIVPLGKEHILCKGMVLPSGSFLMRDKCIKMRWSSSYLTSKEQCISSHIVEYITKSNRQLNMFFEIVLHDFLTL